MKRPSPWGFQPATASSHSLNPSIPSPVFAESRRCASKPVSVREGASPAQVVSAKAYGEDDKDYPVHRDLGLHIIDSLVCDDNLAAFRAALR